MLDRKYHHTRTEDSIISVVLVKGPWNNAIRLKKKKHGLMGFD